MLKLTTKINFSFSKLARRLPDLLEAQEDISVKGAAKEMKDRISKGIAPPLKKSTINIRKLRGRSGVTPLLDKGSLYNSIKGVKGGVQMLEYGKYHDKGFTPKKVPRTLPDFLAKRNPKKAVWFVNNTKGIKVPARPFIFPSEEALAKRQERFIKAINNVMRR